MNTQFSERLLATISTLALAHALTLMTPHLAEAHTWTGAASNSWQNAGNWSDGVPTTGDVIIATETPNPTVLGNIFSTINATSRNVFVGIGGGSGRLTIQNGSTLTSSATAFSIIGRDAGSAGVITVTGAGSIWDINGSPGAVSLLLGNRGSASGTAPTGTLNISNGGAVNTAGDIVIGEAYANGVLDITNGGMLTTGRDGYIGRKVGSNGTATVSGANSRWTIARNLLVGNGGPGALTISDNALVSVTNNSYVADAGSQGTLNITSGGTLQTGALLRSNGTAQVNFDSGILRANKDNTDFISGFSGTELNLAGGGLTIDTAGFDVATSSPFTGTGGLTKAGAGALSLSGSSNIGGINVAHGELQFVDGAKTTSGASTVQSNGAIMTVTGAGTELTTSGLNVGTSGAGQATLNILDGARVTMTNGGTIMELGRFGPSTTVITISGAGSLLQSAGRIQQSGAGGGARVTVTNGGQVISNGYRMALAFSSTLDTTTTISGTGSGWTNNGAFELYKGSLSVLDGGSFVTGSGILGSATGTASLEIAGAGSTFTSNGAFSLAGLGGSVVTMTLADGGRFVAKDSFTIASTTGGVNVLNIGGAEGGPATAAGELQAASVAFGPGTGRINFNHTDTAHVFAPEITGAGSVTQAGPGTTIFTADNNYTGGTTISAGALQLGDGGTGGSVTGDIANEGLLSFNRSDEMTVAGAITGNGSVRQIGGGTTMLTGINNYTGGTTISDGILQLGDGGAGGSLTGSIANDSVLALNRSNELTFGNIISGSGAVSQRGGGTAILTGTNSYKGATTVESGILRINGDQSGATGQTEVHTGATLGGSGIIGGDVTIADGATLAPGNSPGTLTINGDLVLGSGSILDFELGEANVVGGALNDLIKVGGNLTLDGTLNVTTSAGGAFGPGIYRLIDYAGTLTDNGLSLGTMPGGSAPILQTSVAHQVNLINAGGLALNYWDGAAGAENDGIITGGDGTWLANSGGNWTESSGAINAYYSDAAFAIFSGTGGTVEVDNSEGDIRAAGLQFAVDGYSIVGDTITLVGTESTIRVGDGTDNGAAHTASILAELTGTSQLVKTDKGTLILGGNNSYTGGTLIHDGVLQIAGDDALGDAAGGLTIGSGGTLRSTADMTSARDVQLTGDGTFDVGSDTTLSLTGTLSGGGDLTKAGAGSLAIAGNGSAYGGDIMLRDGTLVVESTLNGTVNARARLKATGGSEPFSITRTAWWRPVAPPPSAA